MRVLAGLLVTASVLAAGGGAAPRWDWPVASHRVVRPFEAPATRYAAGHRGIDLAAPVGSEVRSPDDGVVAFSGTVVDRGVVAVDHDGVRSSLEPVEPRVRAGDRVRRGEVLGVVAAAGSHPAGILHLGARVRSGDGWAYVDPRLYLGGAEHAVLLPLTALP